MCVCSEFVWVIIMQFAIINHFHFPWKTIIDPSIRMWKWPKSKYGLVIWIGIQKSTAAWTNSLRQWWYKSSACLFVAHVRYINKTNQNDISELVSSIFHSPIWCIWFNRWNVWHDKKRWQSIKMCVSVRAGGRKVKRTKKGNLFWIVTQMACSCHKWKWKCLVEYANVVYIQQQKKQKMTTAIIH